MKKTIFFLMMLAVIPNFAFARALGKATKDNHLSMLVIRPGEDIPEEDQVIFDYYPGENGLNKKKKFRNTNYGKHEIRIDASLSKAVGNSADANGNYHLGYVYHTSKHFAFGGATGLYYSVGKYATHSVPLLVLADYYFPSFSGITPYAEAYGGYMIGFRNADDKNSDAPNCGIMGMKVGLSYNIYKKFHIRIAFNFFHTTDNGSTLHSETAETCIGPCGSIGYRF